MERTTRRGFIQGASVLAGGMLAQPLTSADAHGQPGGIDAAAMDAPRRFRRQIEHTEILQCPVVHDAISARLAAEHGFPIVMAGGSAMSSSQFGFGDFGMMTVSEMIEMTARIADAVDLPIIADADEAGGNPLNAFRAVRMFERAGAAGILIEDLWGPKHLGSVGQGHLLSAEAMADKIRAAVDARRKNLALVVGCQAIPSGRSAAEAFDRIALYAEAGGDVVFVYGVSLQECSKVAEIARRPVMVSTLASFEELQANNAKINVYSGQLLRVAVGAMDRALHELKQTGGIKIYDELAIDRERMARLTDRDVWIARAKKHNALSF